MRWPVNLSAQVPSGPPSKAAPGEEPPQVNFEEVLGRYFGDFWRARDVLSWVAAFSQTAEGREAVRPVALRVLEEEKAKRAKRAAEEEEVKGRSRRRREKNDEDEGKEDKVFRTGNTWQLLNLDF